MARAKKVITIHVRDDREKEEFLKELQRLRLPAFIYVHGKLNDLKINVQGTKDEIREAIRKIREIHHRVRAKLYPDKRGLYRYVIDDLLREAGASVSTPILVRTLELLGETVEVREGELITSMPWEEIVALVRTLGDYLADVSLQTTRQIREVVLPVAAAKNMDPSEVMDMLVELGLAEWKEDKFKYELVKNKEQALEILLKHLEGEENED
ncbi:hypothetical protein CL1_0310 [Thermococcus cleftensis]|uniref:DUF2067 domain-containing protein n=1 Tax=Thermococcus cleftensis (strain DSM 27260 / KACC 17922 / CL1) TaxID=163003 RepID=I3ZS37_THECF|nr:MULTISPECIES: DUF2067 family protein [Thermococcus]AFL94521.1 hypothetical protein CL1_0310 [Thermococcus cleftensis]NJE03123.1 DUF2067 domain-containing protein [Thermococcus sp. MV11]